jgi:hypothetical protein
MNLIFEVETKYGVFKSSLNVKDDTSPEEIEQIKTNLVNSWIEMIETPPKFNPAEYLEETYEILPEEDLIIEDYNNGG